MAVLPFREKLPVQVIDCRRWWDFIRLVLLLASARALHQPPRPVRHGKSGHAVLGAPRFRCLRLRRDVCRSEAPAHAEQQVGGTTLAIGLGTRLSRDPFHTSNRAAPTASDTRQQFFVDTEAAPDAAPCQRLMDISAIRLSGPHFFGSTYSGSARGAGIFLALAARNPRFVINCIPPVHTRLVNFLVRGHALQFIGHVLNPRGQARLSTAMFAPSALASSVSTWAPHRSRAARFSAA